jgi:hypothetical protein
MLAIGERRRIRRHAKILPGRIARHKRITVLQLGADPNPPLRYGAHVVAEGLHRIVRKIHLWQIEL